MSRSSSEIVISWETPEDRGGIKLTGFNVYLAEDHGDFDLIDTAPATTNPSITYHTQTPLVPGGIYRFKVSATNFVGEGDISDSILVYAADLPAAPDTSPQVTLITQTSLSITIQEVPVLANGGSPITGYIV